MNTGLIKTLAASFILYLVYFANLPENNVLKINFRRAVNMSSICKQSGYHLSCLLIIILFGTLIDQVEAKSKNREKKILVVTVTKGFRHKSIPTAEKMIEELGKTSKAFSVDYVRTDEEMAAKMTPQALNSYDGVIFASTSGNLPLPDRDAFLNWIKAGHAFIGIHAASDTFGKGVYPSYIDMIGGEFDKHGPQVEVECVVEDRKHPATKSLGKSFKVFDEIYQFKNYERSKVHMLLSLDKHPNDKTPGYYPIAWCRMFGKGRVFYTALGHRDDVLQAEWFKAHLLGGIQWTLKSK
jgi:uncharacterized protein